MGKALIAAYFVVVAVFFSASHFLPPTFNCEAALHWSCEPLPSTAGAKGEPQRPPQRESAWLTRWRGEQERKPWKYNRRID